MAAAKTLLKAFHKDKKNTSIHVGMHSSMNFRILVVGESYAFLDNILVLYSSGLLEFSSRVVPNTSDDSLDKRSLLWYV